MKQFQIIFLALIVLSSCDSYTRSGEEDDKLVEAQKLHNESMATFAETLPMLKELTELRTNISKSLGITTGDSTSQTSTNSSDTTNNPGSSDNSKKGTQQSNKINSGNPAAPTDTTANVDSRKVLDELNKAQADLLGWMRNIYKVPNMEGIYEEEKAREGAVGQDHDSEMLRTDMEFKILPEGASSEEILQKQKEMNKEIQRIQEDLKRTIAKAKRTASN